MGWKGFSLACGWGRGCLSPFRRVGAPGGHLSLGRGDLTVHQHHQPTLAFGLLGHGAGSGGDPPFMPGALQPPGHSARPPKPPPSEGAQLGNIHTFICFSNHSSSSRFPTEVQSLETPPISPNPHSPAQGCCSWEQSLALVSPRAGPAPMSPPQRPPSVSARALFYLQPPPPAPPPQTQTSGAGWGGCDNPPHSTPSTHTHIRVSRDPLQLPPRPLHPAPPKPFGTVCSPPNRRTLPQLE